MGVLDSVNILRNHSMINFSMVDDQGQKLGHVPMPSVKERVRGQRPTLRPVHLANEEGIETWKKDLTRRIHSLLGPNPNKNMLRGSSADYLPLDCTTQLWPSRTGIEFQYQLTPLMVRVEHGAPPLPVRILTPGKGCKRLKDPPLALVLHPYSQQFGIKLVTEYTPFPFQAIGPDLVRRGYIVVAPKYPKIDLAYDVPLSKLGYRSALMKAIVDNQCAINVAEHFLQLRNPKIVAMGHSLGGLNAIFSAFFDDRIQGVVASSAFKCFAHRTGFDRLNYSNNMYFPGLANYQEPGTEPFDFAEVIAALAPRLCILNAPIGDQHTPNGSIAKAYQQALPNYRRLGAGNNLVFTEAIDGHSFGDSARHACYDIAHEYLFKKP